MTLATVLAHTEEVAPLIAPPIVIGAVAAVIFLVLLVVTWSFRDIAHRHSDKTDLRADRAHGAGH
jgi:hypothetical protein